ncbi:hypothetical protein GY21_17905 [Cryobacterium roopkundense]|uniref:Uncharacterized protein n=1 Tax=Cryobacterium roopkundense TaxID=1001240 RepID=A0A099J3I7_9MICO|nr:hypothetical protein [Cryobacterium roopkundense]KGJ72072.1 hypothetical protein GY21_17905 [Cryobacterium roopkundense]MBB5643545.1 hypothetical protein [Cryobacterium roopkundense]
MTDNPQPRPRASTDGVCSEPEAVHVSAAAVRRLAEAVAALSDDPEYFVQALTDMLTAMKPISPDEYSATEVRFLIESGAFSAEEWAKTSEAVNRGCLHVAATEAWLLGLFETISLDVVSGFLSWKEEVVGTAVAEGRLYAVEISGRFRFPVWQFDAGSPSKLLPGLTAIAQVMSPRWSWQSVAGFMATPQTSLVAEGPKTPAQWLRDGGDVHDVIEIVEASDWR